MLMSAMYNFAFELLLTTKGSQLKLNQLYKRVLMRSNIHSCKRDAKTICPGEGYVIASKASFSSSSSGKVTTRNTSRVILFLLALSSLFLGASAGDDGTVHGLISGSKKLASGLKMEGAKKYLRVNAGANARVR